MPMGIDLKKIFFLAITAFLSTGALAGVQERRPSMISVNGGIVEYGAEELYVSSFSIAQEALAEESAFGIDCEPPTIGEYILAAKLPKFKVSRTFESVETPPEDACSWSREVLEAEGVEGNLYFAGIGNHVPGELTFVSGGVNPRDSISKIHSNVYNFWGHEYKPSPRTKRCVQRDEHDFSKATIKKKAVQVKSRRDHASKTKMTLSQGARVMVIYANQPWSFIKSKGLHECQTDPEWTTFEDFGWISTTDYE